jgi:hypothetical protein
MLLKSLFTDELKNDDNLSKSMGLCKYIHQNRQNPFAILPVYFKKQPPRFEKKLTQPHCGIIDFIDYRVPSIY